MFDVYEGKGIEPGKKSIAIAVTIQPREKTMTDAEIDALAGKIVAEVGKRTGGVLALLTRARTWTKVKVDASQCRRACRNQSLLHSFAHSAPRANVEIRQNGQHQSS